MRIAALLLSGAIVITGLYVGREVLLPLALAILLSFVLTPALLFLRRLKVPRVIGVTIVVAFAFALIFALGWLMSQQVTQLAGDLPRYQHVLAEKIAASQNAAASPVLEKAADAMKGLERELTQPEAKPATVGSTRPLKRGPDKPIPVEIHEPEPKPFELYQRIAGTVLPPLATAGIVILFVIFILLQREELRDRAIRLLGASDMQRTTSGMNDAAERLSKYFLSQVLINSAYGVFIALGLWLIGVPSPIVWGILAMLMRFVPYVGAFIAAAFPLLLAAVVAPGWTTFLLTFALYLVSEYAMGQVVEPLVYGHGTGVSPIAVVGVHRLLDVAMGAAGPSASHAAHGLPRGSRPPCRRVELLRGAARRQTGPHAATELLSARARGQLSGSNLSGRAFPERAAARDLSRRRGPQRAAACRARFRTWRPR